MSRPPSDAEIGERLRLARERAGRPQRLLALSMQALGVEWSQNHQTRSEQGQRPLRLREAALLADILGVSLAYLLGEDSSAGASSEQRVRDELQAIRDGIDHRLAALGEQG